MLHCRWRGGGVGDPATERWETVTGASTFLIPILNNLVLDYTGRGPDPSTGGKGAANQALSDWKQNVKSLFLNIDQQAVTSLQNDLVNTNWIGITPQQGSALNNWGYPAGDTLGASKSAGYWAMVNLTPGLHTLDFGGSWTSIDSSGVVQTNVVHVIDHIQVT